MCVGAGSLQRRRSSGIQHHNPAGPQRVAGGATARWLAPCCCDELPRSCCSGRAPKTLSSCRSIRAWGLTYRLCLQHTLGGDKIFYYHYLETRDYQYLLRWVSQYSVHKRIWWYKQMEWWTVRSNCEMRQSFQFQHQSRFHPSSVSMTEKLGLQIQPNCYLCSVSTRIFSNRLRISDISKDLLLLYAESNKLRWSKHLIRMELSF